MFEPVEITIDFDDIATKVQNDEPLTDDELHFLFCRYAEDIDHGFIKNTPDQLVYMVKYETGPNEVIVL